MACYNKGPMGWSMTRDEEGHREYKIKFKVEAEVTDSPLAILYTSGLPMIGDSWIYYGEIDPWAFCKANANITALATDDPKPKWFLVEFTFSTKSLQSGADKQRDPATQVGDPLLEPPKISGSFTKYTEEATKDVYGRPIVNSAHEQMRGPQVEFDGTRPNIKIEQNVGTFYQAAVLPYIFMDTLNSTPLWGFPARCVKLSGAPWERKFSGANSVYYTRTLEFDLRNDTFDRDILDEGSKAINGRWNRNTGRWETVPIQGVTSIPNPNYLNPAHFKKYIDRDGNPTRVILDGYGFPAQLDVGTSTMTPTSAGTVRVVKYLEGNLLLLGIPTNF